MISFEAKANFIDELNVLKDPKQLTADELSDLRTLLQKWRWQRLSVTEKRDYIVANRILVPPEDMTLAQYVNASNLIALRSFRHAQGHAVKVLDTASLTELEAFIKGTPLNIEASGNMSAFFALNPVFKNHLFYDSSLPFQPWDTRLPWLQEFILENCCENGESMDFRCGQVDTFFANKKAAIQTDLVVMPGFLDPISKKQGPNQTIQTEGRGVTDVSRLGQVSGSSPGISGNTQTTMGPSCPNKVVISFKKPAIKIFISMKEISRLSINVQRSYLTNLVRAFNLNVISEEQFRSKYGEQYRQISQEEARQRRQDFAAAKSLDRKIPDGCEIKSIRVGRD